MVQPKSTAKEHKQESFFIRTISKGGGARYLSVGKIVPEDWKGVKVYSQRIDNDTIVLKLVVIK